MLRLDKILSWSGFGLAAGAITLGPWFYGSWEMWWLWPMAATIFLSTACFSLRMLLPSAAENLSSITRSKQTSVLLLSFVPFLLYALVRCFMAEVYMDAERSFLLYFLPFLLGIHIILGFTGEQRRILYLLILIDLLCLGVYGLANHFITHNAYVLLCKGYPQYVIDNRATGTFFCPDHFAGIMELAFSLAMAILLTRRLEWRQRLFPALLILVSLSGVILSKSRGGGMAVMVVCLSALIWGLSQRRKMARMYYRFVSTVFLALSILLFFGIDTPYTKRFKAYFTTQQTENSSLMEKGELLYRKLRTTSRGHMFAGAHKAWKTAPVVGIGPGMHQNLWVHYDNSHDGDKESGTWPTYQYKNQVSYEVHNDWLQLLEEYGIIGLILFLIPASVTFALLLRSRKCDHAIGLGGVLAFACMAFHSFGDFNLQMPATTWILGAIIALPLSDYLSTPSQEDLS